jgi:hypothetical protein
MHILFRAFLRVGNLFAEALCELAREKLVRNDSLGGKAVKAEISWVSLVEGLN